MGARSTSNVGFTPKVWESHIHAYRDRKMALGQLAMINRKLQGAKGTTVDFPFYNKLGAAQRPTENEGLVVEPLVDSSFQVTVQEIGKATGFKDSSDMASADEDHEKEAQMQLGELFAEAIDEDIISLLANASNYDTAFTAASAGDVMNVGNLMSMKITGFGDKQDKAIAVAMHSLSLLSLLKDSGTGFLKADATHPFHGAPGYQGLLAGLGLAVFTLDSMPRVSDIGSKKTYAAYVFKPNPFGIAFKQEMKIEKDRDILMREDIVAATSWYGMLSLHKKISTDDKRILRGTFTTEVNA